MPPRHFLHEAEALAVALEYGFATSSDSVDWASHWIDQFATADLPGELLEVAMGGNADRLDQVGHLRRLAGAVDPREARPFLFRRALDALSQDEEACTRIAKALFSLSYESDSSADPVAREMFQFDDALALAVDGVYGEVDVIRNDLRQFLTREIARAEEAV